MKKTKFKAVYKSDKEYECGYILFKQVWSAEENCFIFRSPKKPYIEYDFDIVLKDNRWIKLQYICLKDSLKKEIYEEDIVIDTQNSCNKNWGIITLDSSKWEESFIYGNDDAFDYKDFLTLLDRGRIKIIGNALLNPEIVEKLKKGEYK